MKRDRQPLEVREQALAAGSATAGGSSSTPEIFSSAAAADWNVL